MSEPTPIAYPVRLDELIAYVQQRVGEASQQDQFRQTPSAGPRDLLPYVAVPLSTAP